MDGTLLNSSHEVSDRFFALFEQLHKRGITFIAASGRQYGSMVKKLAAIQDRITFVAENGGYMRRLDQELLVTPIETDRMHEVLGLFDDTEGAYPVLCCPGHAYVKTEEEDFLETLQEYYTEYSRIPNLESFDDTVLKIAVYHTKNSEKHIYPLVKHLEDSLMVKVSGQHWVDLSHQDANKGFAIKRLQDQLGISREETLVFGDYKNDLEMLQAAAYSFAMENAHPDVTRIANYRTSSNDDYGVEKVLEKLLKSLD